MYFDILAIINGIEIFIMWNVSFEMEYIKKMILQWGVTEIGHGKKLLLFKKKWIQSVFLYIA